ncbi:MAG: helicase C-terminal domain-containing protein, partial [Acidithiobacillus sp.]|uniref:helicase C-terminal domain-containing protein n=1 Tax=Acidithiobacillus sp. TaxID=1872118 RepID=UPI00355CD30D
LKHFKTKEPTVIVSPSMTEGLDLKGDLGRFAIIVKLPFLYLGDKQIARRREIDPDWYNYQTSLTLIQAMGRVMRSEDDFCSIYIMDSLFHWFYNTNKKFFPKYITESFQYNQ